MRLYMPVSQLRRCLARDEKFGEYDVPQGSTVYVSVFRIKIIIINITPPLPSMKLMILITVIVFPYYHRLRYINFFV